MYGCMGCTTRALGWPSTSKRIKAFHGHTAVYIQVYTSKSQPGGYCSVDLHLRGLSRPFSIMCYSCAQSLTSFLRLIAVFRIASAGRRSPLSCPRPAVPPLSPPLAAVTPHATERHQHGVTKCPNANCPRPCGSADPHF